MDRSAWASHWPGVGLGWVSALVDLQPRQHASPSCSLVPAPRAPQPEWAVHSSHRPAWERRPPRPPTATSCAARPPIPVRPGPLLLMLLRRGGVDSLLDAPLAPSQKSQRHHAHAAASDRRPQPSTSHSNRRRSVINGPRSWGVGGRRLHKRTTRARSFVLLLLRAAGPHDAGWCERATESPASEGRGIDGCGRRCAAPKCANTPVRSVSIHTHTRILLPPCRATAFTKSIETPREIRIKTLHISGSIDAHQHSKNSVERSTAANLNCSQKPEQGKQRSRSSTASEVASFPRGRLPFPHQNPSFLLGRVSGRPTSCEIAPAGGAHRPRPHRQAGAPSFQPTRPAPSPCPSLHPMVSQKQEHY